MFTLRVIVHQDIGNYNQNPTLYPMAENLWGAIAEENGRELKGRSVSFSKNHTSKDAAQSDALTICQQHAVQKCELSYTYKNGCVAVLIQSMAVKNLKSNIMFQRIMPKKRHNCFVL
ncbi:DUF4189 domain-containing protein [Acinetobacter sp.]|jgi:hypothetical protein|uniref:DUF4189 domain-containing protein n=1 Tax=Acinetobacter sp. TaxID=472 RepID=UPI002819DFC4|nr:DUF4189 domain-containing protein [Acinetobacter sp.]MDR0235050.1 DUF4189 domain-containing protein [Acinetobacter sp.]